MYQAHQQLRGVLPSHHWCSSLCYSRIAVGDSDQSDHVMYVYTRNVRQRVSTHLAPHYPEMPLYFTSFQTHYSIWIASGSIGLN